MSDLNRKIMRIKEVVEVTGVSRSTIYRWVDKGIFPKYVKLSPTSTGWYAEDINNWLESLRNSEVA
ncbi:helix-turn-helix transcriptional regulator [Francisella sp. TX07-6608]|uniref:helix-turn-helix transcriptional regulator n=1 Tax=Francisella sp. TX07-6608 TaxID=573568 RepID=UPI0008F9900F|nr:AlpA family phage regulatory protein [Francisella sp. TX07-6608]OIN83813.1 merR HTH regulatory family protein [Francisella sp. TX07-6608]